MVKEYQVTLFCENNKYKPVSCIVKVEEINLDNSEDKRRVAKLGAKKICQKRMWKSKNLTSFGYTIAKVREYDRQKIAIENAIRYHKIKEEKYNSGEWKRPAKNS